MMKSIKQKLDFEKSGYFFIGLLVLVVLGFWPSYFSKFFDGTADFNFYFHFHAVTATLWLILLIMQPIFIRKKKLRLHRLFGKFSYVLVPLIFISVMLLAHNRITDNPEELGINLWIPFKDLFILGVAYFIAIKYRHSVQIHARGMIAAGIVLIEPALVRFILYIFFPDAGFAPEGYLVTLIIIYSLFISLILI
ncbi:MAG: hypothetical protein AB8G22_23705, partial [Saprospiraceae bacterium]